VKHSIPNIKIKHTTLFLLHLLCDELSGKKVPTRQTVTIKYILLRHTIKGHVQKLDCLIESGWSKSQKWQSSRSIAW